MAPIIEKKGQYNKPVKGRNRRENHTTVVNPEDPRQGRKRHAGNLPACQVCLNPGSGFHYGADTCEPCKTFFRRNFALEDKLECKRSNACKPAASKKFKCTACRLKRCLAMGMSLEGIKLGRYTDSKRARNKALGHSTKLKVSRQTPHAEISLLASFPSLMTPPDTPTNLSDNLEDQYDFSNASSLLDEIGPGFDQNLIPSNSATDFSALPLQFLTNDTNSLPESDPGTLFQAARTLEATTLSGDANCGFLSQVIMGDDNKNDLIGTNDNNTLIGLPHVKTRPSCTSVTSTMAKPMMTVSVQPVFNGLLDCFNTGVAPLLPKQPILDGTATTWPSIQTQGFDTINLGNLDSLIWTGNQFSDNVLPTSFVSSVPSLVPGDISQHLDAFIDHITNIYNKNDAHGSDFYQKIDKFFFEYLENRTLKERVFGSLRPLPLSEYRKILLETGLDVDGRLEQLTHKQLPIYEKSYDLYRKFVCDVPGFQDLHKEDQDILIKRARIDYWMLSEYECFDVEMQLHAFHDGFVMGVEDKTLFLNRPFVKRMFTAAGKFQSLGLTEHEKNLLKCIHIFSRDSSCCTPEGVMTTRKHYEFFRQVLQYCRQKEGRLDISNDLDARLEPLMAELNKLEEDDWEFFLALWKDFPMIRFPPVFKSFYFGSPTSDQSPVFCSL